MTIYNKLLSPTIGSEMTMKTSVGDECVMKICGAVKGLSGFVHLMTYHLNTRR